MWLYIQFDINHMFRNFHCFIASLITTFNVCGGIQKSLAFPKITIISMCNSWWFVELVNSIMHALVSGLEWECIEFEVWNLKFAFHICSSIFKLCMLKYLMWYKIGPLVMHRVWRLKSQLHFILFFQPSNFLHYVLNLFLGCNSFLVLKLTTLMNGLNEAFTYHDSWGCKSTFENLQSNFLLYIQKAHYQAKKFSAKGIGVLIIKTPISFFPQCSPCVKREK
jgi:hypothetical protein